ESNRLGSTGTICSIGPVRFSPTARVRQNETPAVAANLKQQKPRKPAQQYVSRQILGNSWAQDASMLGRLLSSGRDGSSASSNRKTRTFAVCGRFTNAGQTGALPHRTELASGETYT